MTLEELEHTLRNGLQDSEVARLDINYVDRTARMDVQVWVGDMGDLPERREAYRNGRIEISGLLFLIVEPPDPEYPFTASRALRIAGCELRKSVDPLLLQSLNGQFFSYSFFVHEWNSFIHIAARNAELIWEQNSEIIYRSQREHFAAGEIIP